MHRMSTSRLQGHALRQLLRLVAVAAIASLSACAALDKIGKASEKLEEGRLQESLANKTSETTRQTGPA